MFQPALFTTSPSWFFFILPLMYVFKEKPKNLAGSIFKLVIFVLSWLYFNFNLFNIHNSSFLFNHCPNCFVPFVKIMKSSPYLVYIIFIFLLSALIEGIFDLCAINCFSSLRTFNNRFFSVVFNSINFYSF